jgi:hypothetical protein
MKYAAKFLTIAVTAALYSSNAFAISDKELGEACLEKGKEKLVSQAEAMKCELDLESVSVDEVDNRTFNPSKYIWYRTAGTCDENEGLVKMVQYYRGKCL